ncbi:hypothetical protein [Micromonospora palomenae]|uniref:hypothetical protein n=1 Tax=Micromonospora palomenae TaxID=1461247 RepID=UPI003F8B6B14
MTGGRPLSEAELVSAWDHALDRPAAHRPLVLLGRPDADRLPVGAVAALLLRTAGDWNGGRVETIMDCPACPERLEVGFTVAELLAAAPEPDIGTFTLDWRGHRLTLRLPTPADLAEAARAGDPAAAERRLLQRCLVAAEPPVAEPDELLPAVSAAMAERDPLGVVAVALTCPACGTAAEALLDLPAWAWQAADARVRRLLGEVHRLARAYGWSEAEVLGLGPHRRAAYLEQVS